MNTREIFSCCRHPEKTPKNHHETMRCRAHIAKWEVTTIADERAECKMQSNNRKNAGHFIFTSIYSNYSLRERPFMVRGHNKPNSRTTIESAIWYSSIHHFLLICRAVGLVCERVLYANILHWIVVHTTTISAHSRTSETNESSSSVVAAAAIAAAAAALCLSPFRAVSWLSRAILCEAIVQVYAQFSNGTVSVFISWHCQLRANIVPMVCAGRTLVY